MQTIKNIIVETGEECRVDVDVLHGALAKLPAEIYLQLYRSMQEKVLAYPTYFCGCGTPITEEKTE